MMLFFDSKLAKSAIVMLSAVAIGETAIATSTSTLQPAMALTSTLNPAPTPSPQSTKRFRIVHKGQ
jgi:hypothetical protein